jgi:general secretion pathway protein C
LLSDVRMWLHKPWVSQLLCVGFALLLIWEIYSFVRGFWSNQPAQTTAASQTAVIRNTVGKELRSPIFGTYVPKNLSDSNVKQTTLDLSIVGIIFSDKEENSQVIIRTTEGEETLVGVGDSLPDGVIIKRITPEGVMVENQGELESLSFPKNELIFEQHPKPLIEE